MISASQLYDYHHCSHRVWRDAHDGEDGRDAINAFIQLLWDKGTKYEEEVIDKFELPHLNFKDHGKEEKEKLTLEAMERGDPLIYGGRIVSNDLVGEPDILRREGQGYVGGDIKSGSGLEGGDDEDDGKPKPHYALQLALYTDILEKLGKSAHRKAFIWDIKGKEVEYDLTAPRNTRTTETWWDYYSQALSDVRDILKKVLETEPGYSATCKLCHWYTSCKETLLEKDDLTLLPSLGAQTKKKLVPHFDKTIDLANADLDKYIEKKKTIISGIGPDTLIKFQKRAQLRQANGQPYLLDNIDFASPDIEIFYDIEVDPMRDLCYLHGFFERTKEGKETFTGFMVNDPSFEEEQRIFEQAIDYLRNRKNWVMYYYSPYERTWWRKLQVRYPHLLSPEDVDEIYKTESGKSVDLYLDVTNKMIWPTIDHSVKTLAKYFNFNWRDTHPSGAASVEWFDTWVNTRREEDRNRILEYNEDDCIAMRVVLDGIRNL